MSLDATIVSCSPLFVPSGLFSTQQPESCSKLVFFCNAENKTKVHTKTLHDQSPATSQTSCTNTLLFAHCTPQPWWPSLFFSHHVKMFLSLGPLGFVFLLPRTLFPQGFLILLRSLLKCHLLRKLFLVTLSK